jgi:2-polyprenyl-3-methyl-5-hydroxy-6-metoxy-1,4-benzoquinol methylase
MPITQEAMEERRLDEEDTLSRERYFSEGYFDRGQLSSLSEQIALVHETGAKRVLEIGLGNGFVSSFLRRAGLEVTTMDVNPNLEPDVVASVEDLDRKFDSATFDCVLCCEVLEHVSFDSFESSIDQIAKATNRHAILSFPTAKRQLLKFGLTFRFHSFRERFIGFRIRRRLKKLYPAHHWELDFKKRFSKKAILGVLGARFSRVEIKVIDPIPYQTFFICEKD